MTTVNMLEAKANLSKLVRAVESGTVEEAIITRDGKPVARLVPLAAPKKALRLGLLVGKYPPFDYEKFQALDAEVAAMFLDEKN